MTLTRIYVKSDPSFIIQHRLLLRCVAESPLEFSKYCLERCVKRTKKYCLVFQVKVPSTKYTFLYLSISTDTFVLALDIVEYVMISLVIMETALLFEVLVNYLEYLTS